MRWRPEPWPRAGGPPARRGGLGRGPWKNGWLIVTAFTPTTRGVFLEAFDDAVDHEERIAVRQELRMTSLISRAAGVGATGRGEPSARYSAWRLPRGARAEFRIGPVAWLDRDPMAAQPTADEGEVPDDVEDLVAHEFIREVKGSLLRGRSSPRATTAFSRLPPLMRPLSMRVFHVLVEDEGASRAISFS